MQLLQIQINEYTHLMLTVLVHSLFSVHVNVLTEIFFFIICYVNSCYYAQKTRHEILKQKREGKKEKAIKDE